MWRPGSAREGPSCCWVFHLVNQGLQTRRRVAALPLLPGSLHTRPASGRKSGLPSLTPSVPDVCPWLRPTALLRCWFVPPAATMTSTRDPAQLIETVRMLRSSTPAAASCCSNSCSPFLGNCVDSTTR